MSLDAEVNGLTQAAIDLFDAVVETKAIATLAADTAVEQAGIAAQKAQEAEATQQDITSNWQDKLLSAAEYAATATEQAGIAAQKAYEAGQSALLASASTGVVVNAVADLRAAPNNGTATTLGCLSVGDGGGGFWRWDASSTAADNTGTVVLPTGHVGSGRWLRVYDGPVNAGWFGVWKNGTGIGVAALVAGRQYIITAVGTTDFTAIGAASNAVGVVFTATGAGTGTGVCALDSRAAIQAAIDWAAYLSPQPRHGRVYVPSGKYALGDVLHVGYGDTYTGITLEGDSASYRGSFPGAVFFSYLGDRPCISVQGARNTRLKNIACVGLNAAVLDARKIGSFNSAYNIRDSENWYDPSFANSWYRVYAGIAIDPYSGAIPEPILAGSMSAGETYTIVTTGDTDFTAVGATSNAVGVTFVASGPASGTGTCRVAVYPAVSYPSWSSQTQYGRNYSSDVIMEDCYLYGFVDALAVQPCPADGNGDFVRLSNVWVEKCVYGVSVGNTQCRLLRLEYINATMCHTFLTNNRRGLGNATGQGGRLITHADSCHLNHVTQWFSINPAQSGPVKFTSCYSESTWRLGTWASGASRAASLTFDACLMTFSWQNSAYGIHPNFGVPDYWLFTDQSSHGVVFNACQIHSHFSTLVIMGGANVEFNNCDVWAPTELGRSIQTKLACNASLGGIALQLLRQCAKASVKVDSFYNLSTGTSSLGTAVPMRGTYDPYSNDRNYCLNIHAKYGKAGDRNGEKPCLIGSANMPAKVSGWLTQTTRKVSAAAKNSQGTTVWTVNDTVTFSGADWEVPCVLTVTSVAAGTATFTVTEPGTFTNATLPTNPVAPTSAVVADGGGHKGDASFNLTFIPRATGKVDMTARAGSEVFIGGLKGDVILDNSTGSVFVVDYYNPSTKYCYFTLINNFYIDSNGNLQYINPPSQTSGALYSINCRSYLLIDDVRCNTTSGSPTLASVTNGADTFISLTVGDYIFYYDRISNTFRSGSKVVSVDAGAKTVTLDANAYKTKTDFPITQMVRTLP